MLLRRFFKNNGSLRASGVIYQYTPGLSISDQPTDSSLDIAPGDVTPTKLRTELLDQLVASQLAIEAALIGYANAEPTVREQLRTQLSTIAGLRQQIGTASIATLSALQSQVASIMSNAAAASHEAQASAVMGSSSPLGMASFAAREQTNFVMENMKDFDADLRFACGSASKTGPRRKRCNYL